MKKSITKNYIYNLIYQILVMLIPLITTPYLSRVLGAESIGIYSYTLSITTYFILFGSLGVSMYGQREIAYVQDKIQDRSIVFFEILYLRFITLGLSLILFYFLFCMQGEYQIYYRIFALEILANCLDISWFFQGLEEFKKTVLRNVVVKLLSIVFIFCFVKTSADLEKYICIYVFSTFFGNISLWLYLPKFIQKIPIKSLKIVRHMKPVILLFIPQIATQIYTVLDKTMIGMIVLDKSEVGYYEQAQKIIKLLMTIATSFGLVMIPRMAHTYAIGASEKIKDYLNHSFSFILLLTFPLMFGIISVSFDFVPIFYGMGYDKVVILLCLMSPIIILIGLSNVIGMQYLLPTKQQKKYTISVVLGACVNFLLNLMLIRYWQSIGAAVSTVFAELVVTSIQFYLVRKEISFLSVIKFSYKYFFCSIVMFGVSMVVGSFILNSFWSIVFQVFCSVIIYFGLLILWKDTLMLEAYDFFKKKKN